MSPNNEAEEEKCADPIYASNRMLIVCCTDFSPDLCYAVNLLSRFSSNPGKAHWEVVKRVMRYLKYAAEQALIYKNNLEDNIVGYFNADWAGILDDRHSLSSAEADFMAITAAIQASVWLKRLESELNPSININMTLSAIIKELYKSLQTTVIQRGQTCRYKSEIH